MAPDQSINTPVSGEPPRPSGIKVVGAFLLYWLVAGAICGITTWFGAAQLFGITVSRPSTGGLLGLVIAIVLAWRYKSTGRFGLFAGISSLTGLFVGVLALAVFGFGVIPGYSLADTTTLPLPKAALQKMSYNMNFDAETAAMLQRDFHYDKTKDFDKNLTNIGFGSLWSGGGNQGWYVEGVNAKAASELLSLALLQMTASEDKAEELYRRIMSGTPEERVTWEGRRFWVPDEYNPPEPEDKSKISVLYLYPSVAFTQGEKTWNIIVQISVRGDGSRYSNGDLEYCFIHIDSNQHGFFLAPFQ